MSREKELNFFIQEYNWHKGIKWYTSKFTGKVKVHGESSTNYTFYPLFDRVPKRMYSVIPEAKLIYILRDPVDRIISHYIQYYAFGRENRKISEALSNLGTNNPYICRSKYYMQLKQYLNYFSGSNILIITMEELYKYRYHTLQKIFRFLDVDDFLYSKKFTNIRHKSISKRRKTRIGLILSQLPGMNILGRFPSEIRWQVEKLLYLPFSQRIPYPTLKATLRQELSEHLKDDINHLREYIGCDFEGWSV